MLLRLLALLALTAAAAGVLVDDFEGEPTEGGLPPGWKELRFESIERHTTYRVSRQDDNAFLRAEADRSASGLIKAVTVDLRRYPILKWRWRIEGTLPEGDAHTKEGDDYAARIYVNFRYEPGRVGLLTRAKYELAKRRHGEYPPLHTLNYIWANKLPRGEFLPNAYTDRAMMVAVESGDQKAGRWVGEERNVYEDYKKAFGEEPTGVTHVAVMTDTDNTGWRAAADYDDIRFAPLPE